MYIHNYTSTYSIPLAEEYALIDFIFVYSFFFYEPNRSPIVITRKFNYASASIIFVFYLHFQNKFSHTKPKPASLSSILKSYKFQIEKKKTVGNIDIYKARR